MNSAPHRPPPKVLAQPLARAIDDSVALAGLLARVRESEARLRAIGSVLPPGLAEAVRAGPLDEQGWCLLADHAAAAAKLRQCLPRIAEALAAAGWTTPAVKVKVRPRA